MFLGGWQSLADDQVVENSARVWQAFIGNFLNIVRLVGSGLALIMLTYMAISYFSANGKGMPWAVEKQADIKGRQLMNFAIGVAIFIGASNIIYYVAIFISDIIT